MKVSFEGYEESVVTFEAGNTIAAGDLVKMSDNGEVEKCSSAGDVFCGVAKDVRNGYVAVQLKGYANVSYSGDTAPTVGYQKLAYDGSGSAKVDTTNGRSLLVVDVDSTNTKVGFIL